MSGPCFADVAQGYARRFPARYSLSLRLEELRVAVRSNSAAVVDDLRGYFAAFVEDDAAGELSQLPADLDVLLLDAPEQAPPVELRVKPHEPGKRPDKERFADLPGHISKPGGGQGGGGRVVRKQATGMLFLFGAGDDFDTNIAPNTGTNSGLNIAVGPCVANRNQLVNFLCARYMERRVAQGWMLGHAAGVAHPGPGGWALALCGFAGMGKSTLALHLVARGLDFVSNDRVLVETAAAGRGPVLHGIPKHPRLNPGTALGNPELAALLSCALPVAAREAYTGLAPEALRAVEDKYDAQIDVCFGPGRFRLAAPLAGVVVLNWEHGGRPLHARQVQLRQRPDLLEALRKKPGVFYLPWAMGAGALLTAAQCLEALDGVPVLELSGGSDFGAAALACEEFLGG